MIGDFDRWLHVFMMALCSASYGFGSLIVVELQ